MKNLFLLASIICSMNCFSQVPNPDLFQTWYLRFVQSNDLAPSYNVLAIAPPIMPTLTISNTLNFSGQGACNTFNGAFTNVTNSLWQPASFSETGLDCGTTTYNQFEDSYFSFLQSSIGFYQIYPEGTGQVLRMDNPIFGTALFQNFTLKTADFEFERIVLYPNPAKAVLYLSTNQLVLSKIQIINALGQNVRTLNSDFEVIAISELPSALYTLKIDTEIGTVYKKFIKE